MDNDRVVKLLEEIRDLQRAHMDNYRDALRNQEESIRLSKEWHRKASRRQLVALIIFLLIVAGVLWPFLRR